MVSVIINFREVNKIMRLRWPEEVGKVKVGTVPSLPYRYVTPSMDHYIKYEFQSRGPEIKLPPGAGIMNYGSGSESILSKT